MRNFIKSFWPMIITFIFLVLYGLLFGTMVFGEEIFSNEALGISLVLVMFLLVIGIYAEMIYFIIKAANNKTIKKKALWCVCLYFFHIFIIPYFNLKYVCENKNVKIKMLLFSAISVFLFMFGFFVPNLYTNKSLNTGPLIINYENEFKFVFPETYVEDKVGEYDFYVRDRKREINLGGVIYDDTSNETAYDVLNQRDLRIKATKSPVTVLDKYYKELEDRFIMGNVYIGSNNGVRNIYYVFTIEFEHTDTFVNVIGVNLYEDYLDYKDEFFKVFEEMEYIGISEGV